MDPQAAWNSMLEAYRDRDPDSVREHATALNAWLEKGGFPPDPREGPFLKDNDLLRCLAAAGVAFALHYATAWEGDDR